MGNYNMKKSNNLSKPLSKNSKLTLTLCVCFVALVFSFTLYKRESTINTDARLLEKESPYKTYKK